MSFYLDTSFVIPLLVQDAHSVRANIWIAANEGGFAISSWVEAEVFSVIGRKARNREISPEVALGMQEDFENWVDEVVNRFDILPQAGVRAAQFAKNPALQLSAPDALHLAIAMLNGLTLVTFDTRLAEAAKSLSHPAVVPHSQVIP